MDPALIVSLLLNVVLIVLRYVAPRTRNKFDDAVLAELEDKPPPESRARVVDHRDGK